MKKSTKIIAAGAMCALLAATSFAAGSLINIAVDPSIKILVNGEEFKPKDVNGNDVMVFTYNGTTYAPLRALAEAYGLEVGYDSERKWRRSASSTTTAAITRADITKNRIGKRNLLLSFTAAAVILS